MMGNDINGFDGEHEAEMEKIVKTINVRAFMELASAVFNKIKELEGIAWFKSEELTIAIRAN